LDSKQAKAEANKLKAKEIRQKAMESFRQTKLREDHEEPAKKKRRRQRLNTILERKIRERARSKETRAEIKGKGARVSI